MRKILFFLCLLLSSSALNAQIAGEGDRLNLSNGNYVILGPYTGTTSGWLFHSAELYNSAGVLQNSYWARHASGSNTWYSANSPTSLSGGQYNIVSITYAPTPVILTLNQTSGGTISQSGNGTYNSGTSVTVTATPASGYEFVSWSDNSTTNPLVFTISANTTISATFFSSNTTTTIEGQFMSPEAWEDGRFVSANLGLYVKLPSGEWQLVSTQESTDGSYSWEFSSDDSFEYEVRLIDYTQSPGDGIPPLLLPGNGEVVGGGSFEYTGSPAETLTPTGSTSIPPSPPVSAGSSTTLNSDGEPQTSPIYQVAGSNGRTHYYNSSTQSVTTYTTNSTTGVTSATVREQTEQIKASLSDMVGTGSFPALATPTPTPALEPYEDTVAQADAALSTMGDSRDVITSAIHGLAIPDMPSFGQSLSFSGTFPLLGSWTVDLTSYSGMISSFREFLKFLLSVIAWVATIKILRGSSV